MTAPPPRRRSLPARILSLEGALAAFGLYSLISGLQTGTLTAVFWGVVILTGLVVLTLVRRKDWQQHWEDATTHGTGTVERTSTPQPPEPPRGDPYA